MSEEAKLQESIKKTQDLLGKYINKPPLTEKLLRKPPFRFLHDIINAIIKETSFLKGLFTDEELNSSNITDKESKLAYLTKLIDVVKLITGYELSVRPSKIVSGQEPMKTNELLQAIGKALDKKISSSEAISHYKKSLQRKEKQRVKKIEEKKEKKVTSPDGKPQKGGGSENKKKSKLPSSEENKERKVTTHQPEEKIRSKSTKKLTPSDLVKSNDRIIKEKDGKLRKKIYEESTEPKQIVKTIESTKKEKESLSSISLEDAEKGCEEKNSVVELVRPAQNSKITTSEKNQVKDEETEQQQQHVPLEDKNKTEELEKVPKFSSPMVVVVADEKSGENMYESKKSSFLRPPSGRPTSARPGAPKIRGKSDFFIDPNAITQIGDINVIVEHFDIKEEEDNDDDDDDDNEEMVIVDSSGNEENLMGNTALLNKELTQEHGYLVAQILETQRELVNEGNVEIIPNKIGIEWEIGIKKDRTEAVVKEVDKLRETIQILTRTTNPLGKLMDFHQEDAEIMEKELWDWKSQFSDSREELIVERNAMKDSMKPLEEGLKEIEATIEEQMTHIFQTKANIMRNNKRIQKLLNGQ